MLPAEDVEGLLVASLGDSLLEDRRSAHVVEEDNADARVLANGSTGSEFGLHRRQTLVACPMDAILAQVSRVRGLARVDGYR